MAVRIVGQNTLTPAVLNTPETLVTIPSSGIYVLTVDATNLVATETLELWLEGKVISTGSEKVRGYHTVDGVAAQPKVRQAGPVSLPFGGTAKLNQVDGTLRAFEWCVEQVG